MPQYFDDVPPESPYYPFVQNLKTLNITAGISVDPPLFGPDLPLTRAQAAVWLCVVMNLIGDRVGTLHT